MLQYGLPETTTTEYPVTTQGIPLSNYQLGGEYTTPEYITSVPTTNINYTTTIPTTNYEYANAIPATTTEVVEYPATNAINTGVVYQNVVSPITYRQVSTIKHIPVKTIKHVPMVRTRYVPVLVDNGIPQPSPLPLNQQGNAHYVRNYPIYENEQRRYSFNIRRRAKFDELYGGNYQYGYNPRIGLTTAGGNLDDFAFRTNALGYYK